MFNTVVLVTWCVILSVSGTPFRRGDPSSAEEESTLSQFLSQEVIKLQDDMKELRTQVLKLTTSLAQLQVGDTNLQTDVTAIKSELGKSQCQQGRVRLSGWPHVDIGKLTPETRQQTVVFTQAFNRDPVVSAGITALDVYNDRNTKVDCSADNVKRTGFNIHCYSWADTQLVSVVVSWIAC